MSGRDLAPSQYNSKNEGIPYMTGASNFYENTLLINRWTKNPVTISHKGDLLITCKGTIGTMAYNNIGDIHIARQIMSIKTNIVNIEYVSAFLSLYVFDLKKIAKSIIPGISREDLLTAIIPIPPLTEQKRIVDALKITLPVVEKFGKSQDALDLLNNELKAKLQKSILQEAIQGKLVEQDPNDEPAAKLLERIREEKQELVKQGKLKKSELNDSVIFKSEDNKYYEKIGNETKDISDEIPFDIPENWIWSRMKNCCLMIFSGKSPSYSKSPTKCIIIGQQANQWNKIDMRYIKYGTYKYAESVKDFEFLQEGDVLLNSLGNGTLGRCGIFVNIKERILTDGHLFVFRTNNNITAKFILP